MNRSTSDHKPEILQPIGNGGYFYHWDFQEEEVTYHMGDEEEEPQTHTQWTYYEVVVYPTLTSNKIVDAVITAMWPNNYEQKLLNEYNAAKAGLLDENHIKKYEDFLKERIALKNHIDEDCKKLGIE